MEERRCLKCGCIIYNSDDDYCELCKKDLKYTRSNSFSMAIKNNKYGGNSLLIYSKFCETLGWDPAKKSRFGKQGRTLLAVNADTERKRDIQFMFHSNNDLDSEIRDQTDYVENTVLDDGDIILEKRLKYTKGSFNDRLVFVYDGEEYIFYGVYEFVCMEGDTKKFKRISDTYPMQ